MPILFQLERYILDKILVEANPGFNTGLAESSVNIGTSITVASHNTDPSRFMLHLEVVIGPDKEKEKQAPAYTVTVAGRAFFVFKEVPKKEEAEHVLQLNGAAMLYGLLRGQIAQITALGPNGQMLMPTLNFIELQKQAAAKHATTATTKSPNTP